MPATLSTLPEVHEAVRSFSKRAPKEARHIESMAPGPDVFHSPWIRQGDVYLIAIKSLTKDWPETTNRQLAPGLSLGSRHVVEGDVELWATPSVNLVLAQRNEGSILAGPQIRAKERFKIVHPRHAHFSLPAGLYQVAYQMDPATARRVVD